MGVKPIFGCLRFFNQTAEKFALCLDKSLLERSRPAEGEFRFEIDDDPLEDCLTALDGVLPRDAAHFARNAAARRKPSARGDRETHSTVGGAVSPTQ